MTGCTVSFGAIGDLDYDGSAYYRDWPNSTTPDSFPSAFLQHQPTSGGRTFPQVQFVTDMSATEHGCNTVSGKGCVMPPPGPGHFYPYWTLAKVGSSCVWEMGNMHNGTTFGGDAEWVESIPTRSAHSRDRSGATRPPAERRRPRRRGRRPLTSPCRGGPGGTRD